MPREGGLMSVRLIRSVGVLAVFWLACHEPGTKAVPGRATDGGAQQQQPPVQGDDGGAQQQPPDGGTAATCPPRCDPPPPASWTRKPAPNPIPAENAKPGNPGWRDGYPVNAGQVELYTLRPMDLICVVLRIGTVLFRHRVVRACTSSARICSRS
jgi:hypothetical protein